MIDSVFHGDSASVLDDVIKGHSRGIIVLAPSNSKTLAAHITHRVD